MFRYERPQKGRMRQFHQIGVELLGVAQPQGDVEIIAVGAAILRELGVLDRTVLEINTLGDSESRRPIASASSTIFSGAQGEAVGGQPRAARAQSAADSRFEGRGRPAIVAEAPRLFATI